MSFVVLFFSPGAFKINKPSFQALIENKERQRFRKPEKMAKVGNTVGIWLVQ